jgi:hypothetical protein
MLTDSYLLAVAGVALARGALQNLLEGFQPGLVSVSEAEPLWSAGRWNTRSLL